MRAGGAEGGRISIVDARLTPLSEKLLGGGGGTTIEAPDVRYACGLRDIGMEALVSSKDGTVLAKSQ